MSANVEVAKLVPYVALGSPPDVVSVSKLVVYLLLQPGSDAPEEADTTRQSFVYAQIVGGS